MGETIGRQYWGRERLRGCKSLRTKGLGESFYDGPAEGVLRMVALVCQDLGLLCRDESGGVTDQSWQFLKRSALPMKAQELGAGHFKD